MKLFDLLWWYGLAALVVTSVAFRGVGKMGLGRGLVWGGRLPAWL